MRVEKKFSIAAVLIFITYATTTYAQNPNNDPRNATAQLLDPNDHV
jgi:hypothetical protein